MPLRAAPRRVVPVVDALEIGENCMSQFLVVNVRHFFFDMRVLMLMLMLMLMCHDYLILFVYRILFRLFPPPIRYRDDAD